MPAILQTYVIGSALPSAKDIYNLKQDAATVSGVSVISFTGSNDGGDPYVVSSFSEITAVDIYRGIDAATPIGLGIIVSSDVKGFNSTVVGVGVPSYISGLSLIASAIGGSSSVSASGIQRAGAVSSTVIGTAAVLTRDDFITPSNSYVVVGSDQIVDRDRASYYDSSTVIGVGLPVITREGARFLLYGDVQGASVSTGSGAFFLDQTPLDDPMYGLDLRFVLNTDTPDSETVVGSAVIRGFIDEYGTVVGVADISDAQSEGYADATTSVGEAFIEAEELFPTYSTVVGEAFIQETTNTYVINASLASPKFATFRYTISAIEEYTYVPALAGYSNGESLVTALLVGSPIALAGSSIGSSFVSATLIASTSAYGGGGSPPGYYGPTGATGPGVYT